MVSYELDSFGHVNNAVYLQYLEKARNDFMLQRGLEFQDFFRWKKFPLVRKASLSFFSPARAGEWLCITGKVASHSATSFTLEYEIRTEPGGRRILQAETSHVFVNENNRPVRIPEDFFSRFIAPVFPL